MNQQRIDGWKAIGAYLGRDRTTAIRWARDRGLPVHRIPGGQKGTVYALKDELDAWQLNQSGVPGAAPAPPPIADPAPPVAGLAEAAALPSAAPARRPLWPGLLAALAVLLAVGAAVVLWQSAFNAAQSPMPQDPELAALYLEARDDWALRTPEALARAITNLEEVTRREPGFAPAHASLAEAWLLAGEFGATGNSDAFTKAERATREALRLDPNLAPAHRAQGFIAYWWHNDPVTAGKAFRQALKIDPDSAQTHFWYGNILSDNGQHDAALRELNRARLIEPGSIPIQVDYAYAQWLAGQDDVARNQFRELLEQRPDDANLLFCVTDVYLADNDVPGYVAIFDRYAEARGEPELLASARKIRLALAQGEDAARDAILRDALDAGNEDYLFATSRAAFIASSFGKRDDLLQVLERALRSDEKLGNSGYIARIANRWPNDPEIGAALRQLRPPMVE